ncbi:hypothetical protein Vafri_21339 [Volvox africanus]|uniref:Uncharacterized protein n=1 Tax=Volvox africanus TaxID=51714 RepID=A0A8J4BRN7_9CHLO|nr:hypothetical protein Vafri_21339 [Volvox africanus]
MKRSLNSASLDASSDGAESVPFRPSPSELGGETQGPRISPVARSARLQHLPDDPAQASDVPPSLRQSSSGRSRRRRHRRADPWESYVRDNWIPTLEHTFGPDWRRHCPGEVAALIWWAIASRMGSTAAATAAAVPDLQHSGSPPTQPMGPPGPATGDAPRVLRQGHLSAAAAASLSSSPSLAPPGSSRGSGMQGVALPLHALLFPLSADSLLTPRRSAGGKPETAEGSAAAATGNSVPQEDAAAVVAVRQQHGQCGAALAQRSNASAVPALGPANNDIGPEDGASDHGNSVAPCTPVTVFAAMVAGPTASDGKWASSQQSGISGATAVVKAAHVIQRQAVAGNEGGSGGSSESDGVIGHRRDAASGSGDGDASVYSGEVFGASAPEISSGSRHGVLRAHTTTASTNLPAGISTGGLLVAGPAGWDAKEEADLLFMLQQGLEARLAVKQQQQQGSDTSECVAQTSSTTAGGSVFDGGSSITGASGRTLPVLDLSRPYLSRADGGNGADVGSGGMKVQGRSLGPQVSSAASSSIGTSAGRQSLNVAAGSTEHPDVQVASTADETTLKAAAGGDRSTAYAGGAVRVDGGNGPLRTLLNAVSSAIAAATSGGGAGTAGVGVAGGELPSRGTALLSPGSAWPARILLPPESSLPLAAVTATSKTYNMQLPDGTVVPVQLVPLHVSMGSGGATETPGVGDSDAATAAAAAAALAADDLSSLLAASAAAVGGCRPLSELLNRSDPQGRLPLHAAAATGRVEMVERLLALGCDAGRRLEQDFIHGGRGDASSTRLDCDYDCASSASSSYTYGADEDDSTALDDANVAEVAMPGPRRRPMAGVGIEGAVAYSSDGRTLGRQDGPAADNGGAGASAAAGSGGGDVDDGASGGSFTDSDDMAFGADDGSPSSMSVAQAARLGLHIALDTCGDRLTPDQLHFLAGKFAEQQLWKSTASALMPSIAPSYNVKASPTQAAATSSAGASMRDVGMPTVHLPTGGCYSGNGSGYEAGLGSVSGMRKSNCSEPAHMDPVNAGYSYGGTDTPRQRPPIPQQEATAPLWQHRLPGHDPAVDLPFPSPQKENAPGLFCRPSSVIPNPALEVALTNVAPAAVGVASVMTPRGGGLEGMVEQQQQQQQQQGGESLRAAAGVDAPGLEASASSAALLLPQQQQSTQIHGATGERRKRHGQSPERLHDDEQQVGAGDDDEGGMNCACSCNTDDVRAPAGIPSTRGDGSSNTFVEPTGCHNGAGSGWGTAVPVAGGAGVDTGSTISTQAAAAMRAAAGVVAQRRRPRRLTASAARTVGQQQQQLYQIYDDPRTRVPVVGSSGRNKRQADGDAVDVGLADGEGDGGHETGHDASIGGGSVGGDGATSGDGAYPQDGVASGRALAPSAVVSAGSGGGGGGGGGTWVASPLGVRTSDRRSASGVVVPSAPPSSGPKRAEYIDDEGGVDADEDNDGGCEYDSNPDIDLGADVDDADLQGFGVALLDGLGSLPLSLPLGLSGRRFRRGRVPAPFAARPSYVGASPLHLAAAHGHLAVCEVLLRAPGCDLAARTAQGRTALHLAARNGHETIVALLLRSAATAAAATNAAAAVSAVGAPLGSGGVAAQSHMLAEVVDATDIGGHTALHHAAALGHWRVVEELWPRGASIDAADGRGRTPLHYAAMAGHVETAGRLIIAGAGVHRLDCDGYTPAHLAAMRGHAEVLEKLLLAGYELDLLGGPAAPQLGGGGPGRGTGGTETLSHVSSPRQHLTQSASLQDYQPQIQHIAGPETTRDVPTRPALRPLQHQSTPVPEAVLAGRHQPQLAPTIGFRPTIGGGGAGGHTALHLAASGGHCAAIAVLLQHGGGAERRDWRGCTPLHRAAEGGHRGAFELLLMHGADPRVTDSSGASILHSAARGGNLAVVQRLLDLDLDREADADTGGRSGGGQRPDDKVGLSQGSAQTCGPIGAIVDTKEEQRLGKQAQSQSEEADTAAAAPVPTREQGLNALGGTGGGGSGWGINPAAPALDGRLPLHWAAAAGQGQVVAKLLQLESCAGGDPLRQDHGGATAWHLAAAAGQEASIRVFLAPPPGVAPVRVDARDGDGCTALHRAAAAGAGGVVAVLLEAGADPAAADDGGRTPLHYAAEAGLVEVMRLLLEHVATEDVDRRDAFGWSALHHAAEQGNAAMLQLMLQRGACPHSATANGWTPAHLAARGHHVELLADLLVAGADPRVSDADGCTPLHFAALRGDKELFERLLAAAAAAPTVATSEAASASSSPSAGVAFPQSLALRDVRGYTLLHYAVEGGNLNIIKQLLAAGLSEAVEEEATVETGPVVSEATPGGTATGTAATAFSLGVILPSSVLQAPLSPTAMASCTLVFPAQQQGPQHSQDRCNRDSIAAPEEQLRDGSVAGASEAATQPDGVKARTWTDIRPPCDISPHLRAPVNALHLAAKLCMVDVVQVLLVAGYSATSRTAAKDQTPLHFAAMGPMSTPIEAHAAADAASAAVSREAAAVDAAGRLIGSRKRPKPLPATHAPAPQPPYLQLKQQRRDVVSSGGGDADSASSCHAEQMVVVDALMAAGADPLANDASGCTALSYAAGSGNHALVSRLLALGCDPLRADRRGLTPLHWGAAGGNAEVVGALLAAGGNGGNGVTSTERLASLDCLGRTPLHWAAEAGSLGCVAVLTGAMLAAVIAGSSAGTATSGAAATLVADLLHAPDAGGCSAAQLAAAGGHVDVVARLLEAGAGRTVAAADADAVAGLSALHLAAQAGLEQVVAQLLCLAPSGSVDVNSRDAEGFTPLHAAATRGSAAIVARLLRAGADSNIASSEGLLPLHAAAAGGHLDVVELLLDAGSLVSYKSSSGATPLHQAASNGHAVVCEVLLDAGCPVMGRLASGASALYCAASAGWEDVVELLLRSGAEVDAATSSGCTALHGAASNGHAKVISLLLVDGADSDLQSSNGHTPLHNAAGAGHAAAVEALLAGGADVDAQNSNGNTPLHTAASKGYLDVVSQLLTGGADLHIRNSKGWCAVHSAASNGFFEVVLKLVQAGASWRRQGEADVVRLLTRKTTYKTSYVEGRLRLAERERHRINQQQQAGGARQGTGAGMMMLTGGPAAGSAAGSAGPAAAIPGTGETAGTMASGAVGASGRHKGAVPTAASFEDLAAAADANMAALLEEEAAAAAAAAERKAKQKKKKANKAANKSASANAASGVGVEAAANAGGATSPTSCGVDMTAKQEEEAAATGAKAKGPNVSKVCAGSSIRTATASQDNSGNTVAATRPATSIASPGSGTAADANNHKGAGVAAGSGGVATAATGAATGRVAAAASSTSPKKSTVSAGTGPGSGHRSAKIPTTVNAIAAAVGSSSGRITTNSLSVSSPLVSPLKGGTGAILQSSTDSPPAANGPTISPAHSSGSAAGTGSKAKGQGAMAGVVCSGGGGDGGGSAGAASRGVGVKSAVGNVDGPTSGLETSQVQAAAAGPVETKQKGASASAMTAMKTQLGGKRGASANATIAITSPSTAAVAGGGRISVAQAPAGVDVTTGAKQAGPTGPVSPRQQRTANREAAGVAAVPSVTTTTSGATSASEYQSGGPKAVKAGPGGKGAIAPGGQSPPWQLSSAAAAAASPSQVRAPVRNGATAATSFNKGAAAGSSPPSAAHPAGTTAQTSYLNAKPVTLAQVVAGTGKHGGSSSSGVGGGGSGNGINGSFSSRKPIANRLPSSSFAAQSAPTDDIGTSAVTAGGDDSSGGTAGSRPSAAVAPVLDAASEQVMAGVPAVAAGNTIAHSTITPVSTIVSAGADLTVAQPPLEQPPVAPAPTIQQQQLHSPFVGTTASGVGLGSGFSMGLGAATSAVQMAQVLGPLVSQPATASPQLSQHSTLAHLVPMTRDNLSAQSHTRHQPQPQPQPQPHAHAQALAHLQQQPNGAAAFQGFARPAPLPQTAPGYSPIAESLRLLEPGSDRSAYPQPPPGTSAPQNFGPGPRQGTGLGLGAGGIFGGPVYTHAAVNGAQYGHAVGPMPPLGGSENAAGLPAMTLGAIRAGNMASHPYQPAGTAATGSSTGGAAGLPSSATAASAAAARQLLPSRPAASQPVSPIRTYGVVNEHGTGAGSGPAPFIVRQGVPVLPQGLLHNDWAFVATGASGGGGRTSTAESLNPSLSGSLLHPPMPPPSPPSSQTPIFDTSPGAHLLPGTLLQNYPTAVASSPPPPPGMTRPAPSPPPHALHLAHGVKPGSGPAMQLGGLSGFGAGGPTWTAVRAINADASAQHWDAKSSTDCRCQRGPRGRVHIYSWRSRHRPYLVPVSAAMV